MGIKIWKTKTGEKITTSEFFTRWGEGIAKVTLHDKLKLQIKGTIIILVGLICGLIVSLVKIKVYWWIAIVLIGAILINGMQLLGMLNQKKMLDNIEKDILGGKNEQKII